MLKKLLAVLAVVMFAVSLTAHNTFAIEPNHGSITVYLEQSVRGTSIANVEFELIKVGELTNGQYVLTASLEVADVDLNGLKNADDLQKAAETLLKTVNANGVTGVKKATDKNGAVKFGNLDLGVYLLKSLDTKHYDHVSPALIAIPTYDATKNSPNDMIYDVDVAPKHTVRLAAKAVKTGDDSNVLSYLSIAGIACCGMGLAYYKRKHC